MSFRNAVAGKYTEIDVTELYHIGVGLIGLKKSSYASSAAGEQGRRFNPDYEMLPQKLPRDTRNINALNEWHARKSVNP